MISLLRAAWLYEHMQPWSCIRILAVKILALYDIHGNRDALEAVLADPRATVPDVVVIGGDAVPGPEASATLDRLQAISSPIRWVRGNGEREVADAIGREPLADD